MANQYFFVLGGIVSPTESIFNIFFQDILTLAKAKTVVLNAVAYKKQDAQSLPMISYYSTREGGVKLGREVPERIHIFMMCHSPIRKENCIDFSGINLAKWVETQTAENIWLECRLFANIT